RRQRQERDVVRHSKILSTVPSSPIEDHNGMGTRCDLVGDDVEMQLHGFTITVRQHKGSAGSTLWADCAEDPGRLRTLVMYGLRSDTFSGPTIGELVLLAHPHLVLEPQLYGCIRREPLADFCHKGGELLWDGPPLYPAA